jgi:Tfp pilus assembly protein PilO
MDLNELTKLNIEDLKKLDYKVLAKDLKKRPDILAILGVILVTLVICLNIYAGRQNEIRGLQSKASLLERKIKLIDEYDAAQKELEAFRGTLPKKMTESELIDKITDLTTARNIRIESFSPAGATETPLYTTSEFSLNIATKNYKDALLFIYDIEKSPYSIRVDHLSVSPAEQKSEGAAPSDSDTPVNMILRISLVILKNV